MSYVVKREDFPSIEEQWSGLLQSAPNNSIFLTPLWQKVWWQRFQQDRELLLLSVRHGPHLVGIAPLMKQEKVLSFVGDSQVCDFMDFIASQGQEGEAMRAVWEHLEQVEWQTISLSALLPDSIALNHFVPLAKSRGYAVETVQVDVSPKLDLPPSWEEYFPLLKSKDRHELRRKLRRLSQEGSYQCYAMSNGSQLPQGIDDFLRLFLQGEGDKREFMTPQMVDFFREMAISLAEAGYLRLCFLDIHARRVAAAMCFDYGDELYLYNCGYDPAVASLSPGLMVKVLTLKDAILAGKKRFHFLRGKEAYKYDLGGQDVPVFRCLISRP